MIQIFYAASKTLGRGHEIRCYGLCSTLECKNLAVSITQVSPPATADEIQRLLSPTTRLVVVDIPNAEDSVIEALKRSNLLIVTLDWFGNAFHDISIAVISHGKTATAKEQYLGLEYSIIRKRVTICRKSGINPDPETALVVIGSGDVKNKSESVSLKLRDLGYRITLALGPNAADPGPSLSNTRYFRILRSPADLPELMLQSDLVVTNGGTCMLEAMHLGKPVIAVPQSLEENSLAQLCWSYHAILGVGDTAIIRHDRRVLRTTSIQAERLIDGLGLDRVADIICNALRFPYEERKSDE